MSQEEKALVEVECIQGLWDDQNFAHGRTYKLEQAFIDANPDHFRSVGYLASEAERIRKEEEAASAPNSAGQERFERMSDQIDRQEALSEIGRARAERERLSRVRAQLEEDEKAAAARVEANPPQPTPAPPPQPEEDKAPPPSLGGNVPRAERMKTAAARG